MADRAEGLRRRFAAERGYWNSFWEDLLQLDPDFFDAYIDFSSHVWRRGVLAPKIKELIYCATDASTTHLHEVGLRQHVRNARQQGATKEEILAVLEIAAGLGIQACTLGMPILLEELNEEAAPRPLNVHEREMQERFEGATGTWDASYDVLLRLDSAYFSAYAKVVLVPTLHGALEPKVREFVQIALNASVTHFCAPALRHHIRSAIAVGATRDELIEVLELCSGLGVHACILGVPMLFEEERARASR